MMAKKTKKNPFLIENRSVESFGIKPYRTKRYTKLQKILLVSISLISLGLIASSFIRSGNNKVRTAGAATVENHQQRIVKAPVTALQQQEHSPPLTPKKKPENKESSISDDLFKHFSVMKDFSEMEPERVYQVLTELCRSQSPLIAANAYYNLAAVNHKSGYHLEAFRLASTAFNLIDFVQYEAIDTAELKTNCNLLALNSFSHHVLSIDNNSDTGKELTLTSNKSDFFEKLTEQQSLQAASSGVSGLLATAQKPIIEKIDTNNDAQGYYTVFCHNLPLESLLVKLAVLSGYDLRFEGFNGNEELKKRPVTLNSRTAPFSELVEYACNSASFLVKFEQGTDAPVATIINPQQYQELSSHLNMLNRLANNLWTRFLLQDNNSRHKDLAHVMLGQLYKQNKEYQRAIAEFQLVANTFPQTSMAPVALLYSAETKKAATGGPAGKDDLTRLIEQYPSSLLTSDAYLDLANISFETADYRRAIMMYQKIFLTYDNLDTKALAAYKVAQSYNLLSEHANALNWLSYYLGLANSKYNTYYPKALLETGKANLLLKRYAQANEAFVAAMKFDLPAEDYPVAVFGVIEGLIHLNDLAAALATLENINMWQLTPEQGIRAIQMKADVYHRIGLSQQAIAILADRIEYISDINLRTNIILQLCDYLMEGDNPRKARRLLAQCVTQLDDLQQIHAVNVKLAEACLMLSDYDRTIAICSELLAEEIPVDIRQHAQQTLAKAYEARNDYENTALVLMGTVPLLDQGQNDMKPMSAIENP